LLSYFLSAAERFEVLCICGVSLEALIFICFQDNMLPTGEKASEGFSITLHKVDRHQAGVYQCTASNGVGEPVTVDMQLDVLCEYCHFVISSK
jgi:hypothetical protein